MIAADTSITITSQNYDAATRTAYVSVENAYWPGWPWERPKTHLLYGQVVIDFQCSYDWQHWWRRRWDITTVRYSLPQGAPPK